MIECPLEHISDFSPAEFEQVGLTASHTSYESGVQVVKAFSSLDEHKRNSITQAQLESFLFDLGMEHAMGTAQEMLQHMGLTADGNVSWTSTLTILVSAKVRCVQRTEVGRETNASSREYESPLDRYSLRRQ
jgi:Ca2+-binding EF-hand superfamily protein